MPDPHAALREHFGFPAFRAGQEEALQHVLAGRDTLVVMPTGAGKSLIYQLAALILPGTALVISPLVALMKDQVDGLTRRGIAATFINSSLDGAEQSRRLRALAEGQYKIVLVAPERLRSRAFREAMTRVPLSLLTVDEAHCLSQWGHDFRPDYLRIAEAREEFKPPATLALTATATPRVQDDMLRLLGLPRAHRLVSGFNRPNLTLEVISTPSPQSKLNVVRDFLAEMEGAGIIYTGTRRDAEDVATFIRDTVGAPARHYHAALDAATRAEVQDAFLSGDLPLIVATNAFGMGIDRPDVRFVLHYAVPGSLEAYYQEAGRAGRDGLPARAILLYSPKDTSIHEFFIENDAPTADELRQLHTYLQSPLAQLGIQLSEIEQAAKLGNTKLRVALEQLEMANALRRLPDEVLGWVKAETLLLTESALRKVSAQIAARRDHKRFLLERMAAYAEANTCRRRIILDYFGDASPADAPLCCDNCLTRAELESASAEARPAQTQSERAALIVLDTIAHLKWEIGKGKLAQLLKGSTKPEMANYQNARNFAKFAALRVAEVEALIEQLLEAGYLKQVGSRYPTLKLTPKGEAALKDRIAIQVDLRPVRTGEAQRRQAEISAGGTIALTGQMLARGLRPEQIAAERGLTIGTIYSHLARLIAEGRASVEAVIPPDILKQIRAAIEAAGSAQFLAPIKARLPDDISYDVIRCVANAWQREQTTNARELTEAILACVEALPGELPRSGIAKLLVGSDSIRVERYRQHPLFNRLANHTRVEVTAQVDALLEQGRIIQDESGHLAPAPDKPDRLSTVATPVTRSGAQRAHRAHALGESGLPEHVPELVNALNDPDGNVRRLAASALGKLRAAAAVEPLLTLLDKEPGPQVRQYAIKALGQIKDERARPALERIAANPNEPEYNRHAAQAALRQLTSRTIRITPTTID
jgi:ATP-dependent DNA helicase RecQ